MIHEKSKKQPILQRLNQILIERSDFTAFNQEEVALNFGRFEYKYLVPESLRRRLEETVKEYMVLDANCSIMPSNTYRIRSVYFDDQKFSCYHEKIDGLLNRRKFRIRTYGEKDNAIFLEEKGRRNAFCYKQREIIPSQLYSLAVIADWRNMQGLAPCGSKVWNSFISAGMRASMRPILRVDYDRRAYVDNSGSRFRVTFDSELRAVQTIDIHDAGLRTRKVHPGMNIVEIKFERQVPLWFIRLVESINLQQISISKYCVCAEALEFVVCEDSV